MTFYEPCPSAFSKVRVSPDVQSYRQLQLSFDDLEKWKNSVYAKIVKKCGSRRYLETWAKDIADIANRHIEEIKLLIKKPEIAPKFKEFLKALQQNLNSSIKTTDAIEMLAQHIKKSNCHIVLIKLSFLFFFICFHLCYYLLRKIVHVDSKKKANFFQHI